MVKHEMLVYPYMGMSAEKKKSPIVKRILMLIFICSTMRGYAMSAANSYVRIYTDDSDVLSLKAVGRDFHLLVTNSSARVQVSVEAIYPWGLVRPTSGSCIVSLAASGYYEVQDVDPDASGNLEPNKNGRIIMFKPTFTVAPDFPSGMFVKEIDATTGDVREAPLPGSTGELTDNHTATVTYVPIGDVATLKGHQGEMRVKPDAVECELLHHPNVNPNEVSVKVNVNTVKWKSSKIYWYGTCDQNGHTNCCYTERFKYVFDLIVDGINCYSCTYDVGWPKCTPGVDAVAKKPNIVIEANSFIDSFGVTKWKARIAFVDFTKESQVTGEPYTCQYGDQISEEERIHCDQFKGVISSEEGGSPDLFSAKGIVYWARQNDFYLGFSEGTDVIVQSNDVYVITETRDEALLFAKEIKDSAVNEEYEKCWSYLLQRRNWAEYNAKKKVKYNAAWRYHCTYGKGSDEMPTYVKHPAFR